MKGGRRIQPAPPEVVARLRRLSERVLSAPEFEALVKTPMSSTEKQGIIELSRWFCRRYPTPAERLAYARRAYARWKQGR